MVEEQTRAQPGRKDFFISYTGKDRAWAEWIAMQLEDAGYTTIIQAWDIRPGSNFVIEMDNAAKLADRTIAVLSSAYLDANYTPAEWTAAFRHDPSSKQGQLLPILVEKFEVSGLLGAIVHIDLVGLNEQSAREKLLADVKRERAKPASVPFPASQPSSQVPQERPAFPGSLPPTWNIPYSQNPLFTGREDLLSMLATALHVDQPMLLSQKQAISGLGGVGKTQLALEYAYQHRQDYHAVLWAQANTREALTASFLSIATLLNLPAKDEPESDLVIAAVKNWLQTQTNWLLILDNADDLKLAHDFLPPNVGGHVILTTRAQAMGRFAQHLEVDTFSIEQATLFLLRRAGLLTSNTALASVPEHNQSIARDICEQLGYLPLALDQAGAYIEETGCSLIEYLHLFQSRRADLLAERGGIIDDHPQPVAATWSLSFERVEQANPAAADLLRLCAFLASDAIPESIIIEGASHLGPHLAPVAVDPYQLNKAIAVLRSYSLLRRETSDEVGALLSIHRLVQAVLQDQMDEQNRRQWSERTINAVNAALPKVAHENWPRWERLLAHTLICSELIEQQNFRSAEATRLLNQTGWYLAERVRYREAETLLVRALSISEQEQGSLHLDTARDAGTLGWLYDNLGKYVQAEPLFQRALLIHEQQLGPDHPNTASSLNNLAGLYESQGNYVQAEPLLQRALLIREQQLGPDHPNTASSLNNLAGLYKSQGNYAQAEPLYQRALLILEQQLGPLHPNTFSVAVNYFILLVQQEKFEEAIKVLVRFPALQERFSQSEDVQ